MGTLPLPARYFPVLGEPYRISAGLHKLGSDFGNGAVDAQVVQIDVQHGDYLRNKMTARRERLEKYFATQDLSPEVEQAACETLRRILVDEHPQHFERCRESAEVDSLICHLTGERLYFERGKYCLERSHVTARPAYVSGLDALVCQIQEDVAITCRGSNRDWLAAAHVCAPGHWSPEEKIGCDFITIHSPIPLIDPIAGAADGMLRAMIEKGPFVRFVWGFSTDTRLNHHPEPPPEWDTGSWQGRKISASVDEENPFHLRVERQVMLGLPEVNASLFMIRVYYIPGKEIRENSSEREKLVLALTTMDEETRRYKGLTESMDALLKWLNS